MRPVRLTMQAFGPYPGREVIDFRDAVEVGLFGIYGQTGSGKSTIFSAMTFALFGESSKTDQDASSLRSDHADPGVQTEVEFVFDIGGRRYVVQRRPDQMRPKQRGDGETKSPHEAFLFDATGLALDEISGTQRGTIIAEKKVSVVDSAVAEMLGYGAGQFRQIVLLPQGRFEAFLAAKTKERLEILRDLFDVSLYQYLATKLKTDADSAERYVREERELCVRRLAAESFESKDALIAGITTAEELHTRCLENEEAARAASEVTMNALREAEETQNALAQLELGKGDIDALACRVAKAEKARTLLDAEGNVTDAAGEVRRAEETLRQTQTACKGAEARAKSAAEVLDKEIARSEEIEALRRRVEELDRHEQILKRAKGTAEAVEKAVAAEREVAGKVEAAQKRVTTRQNQWREKSDALKAIRQIEAQRQEITSRLATLNPALVSAETFERAEKDVQIAKGSVETAISEYTVAKGRVEEALATYGETERDLSAVQALHLASKLVADSPCPVCGATEHPAPATGAIENVGLDQAFRDAKAAWQIADNTARAAVQKLTGAQSVLKERQDRLANLHRPENSAAAILAMLHAEIQALERLGPKIDIAAAEAEVDRLSTEVETLAKGCSANRETLSDRQMATAAEKARLLEMLTGVPESLRNHAALIAAREREATALAERHRAKSAAEKAATDTREAALAAQKDFQSAEQTLLSCKQRQSKVIEMFGARLEQTGLSADEYRTLKPAIATIDEDRVAVEGHRRKLENAVETARKAAEVIREHIRPDLQNLEAKRRDVEQQLTEATSRRSGIWHRVDQLTKLRDDLSEAWRKLDEAEAASGNLRNLAKLVNGENVQKLDLETFAIGAMFDRVLGAANLRLGPMTSHRYRLERDLEGSGRGRRGLGIQVFDIFTGKARSTTTLSGGETFIAALALALGLADVVESTSGKVRLDTIFIDEGFGSLDTENGSGTLDQVLQALSSLVSQNRAVGLISHVALVQEAIPNGFYVRKNLAGSSVEARGVI